MFEMWDILNDPYLSLRSFFWSFTEYFEQFNSDKSQYLYVLFMSQKFREKKNLKKKVAEETFFKVGLMKSYKKFRESLCYWTFTDSHSNYTTLTNSNTPISRLLNYSVISSEMKQLNCNLQYKWIHASLINQTSLYTTSLYR